MRAIRIAGVALLVLAAAAVAGVGLPETAGGAEADAGGITVVGTGTVEAVPNEAEFTLGVSTEASTAREALAANSARMRDVLAALGVAGVAKRDIKTQDVSIGPSYDGEGRDGYAARNSVSVRIRDLDRAGAVLDAASRAGANEAYGPSLMRSDRERFEAVALQEAVKRARKRAQALAEAAGVELGPVTAITEASQGQPVPLVAVAERAKGDVAAPIEAGTEEIQASVTVTFAIE